MAEKVEIIVTAKDSASQVLKGIGGAFGGIKDQIQNILSGNMVEAITKQIIEFGKQSVQATVAYADEVRRLSQISGDSAEETSRLIQLADDYKISTGELTIAMRKLTNEGLTLNVETLGKLSDEYKSLNPGQERAAFLMEKFGRQGVKFAEIMALGSSEINRLNAEISDNLILTEQAVINARKYEKAMDALEEQTQKLQYAFGNDLIPVVTDVVTAFNNASDEQDTFGQLVLRNITPIYSVVDAIKELSKAHQQNTLDQSDMADAYKKFADDVKKSNTEIEVSLEELSKANQQYIKDVQKVAALEKDYSTETANLTDQRRKTQRLLNEEIALGYGANAEKVFEYRGALAELDDKISETAAKHNEAIQRIIADNILAKLSVDGITQAEMQQYLAVETAFGMITEKDAALALAQQKITDAFIAGKISVDNLNTAIQNIPSTKNIDLLINLGGNGASYVLAENPPQRVTIRPRGATEVARASGGPVNAGEWYRVNETNTEYFRPNMAGSIMPIGPSGAGGGTSIIINANTIIGDRAHLENYMLPIIREGVRQIQAGR